MPRASRPSATHVIAAPADVFTRGQVHVCVLANGVPAVPQVKAISKVRFRFASREFAACERRAEPCIRDRSAAVTLSTRATKRTR